LVERDPAFYKYLLDYPQPRPPGIEDFFYWSKQKIRKPVVSLVHVCLQRREREGGVDYRIALKHLYDSHYFLAYAEFVETLPCAPPARGFYLVWSVRARIDPPPMFRGVLLGKVKRAMKSALIEDLAQSRSRLEVAARP